MDRWIDRIRLRLRSLFRRGSADAELARELALHLEEQIQEYVAGGMSPEPAREAARRAFGPVATIEEQCRDTRRVALLQNLGQDTRHALRSLLRQPVLVVAATASIGIGVCTNALMFSLATELLFGRPSTRATDQLVNVRLGGNSHVSYTDWRALDESQALAGLAGYQIEQSINWRNGDRTVSLVPLIATANFFDLLGVPVAVGRGFTAREAAAERDPRVVVVSHGFWQRRLGADPAIVGRTLTLNGSPYTVLGVLPAGLRAVPGFGLAPEIYLPLSRSLMPDLDHPVAGAVQLVGRLREGQTVAQGRAALNTVVQRRPRLEPGVPSSVGQFSPVTDGLTGMPSLGAFFGMLLVVSALVLAIACANVTGLLLARSTVRRREIAVRIALGATRGRLLQQLLAESLWLSIMGTVGGLALMLVAMQAIARVPLPLPLPLELQAPLDWRLLGYALTLVTLATLFGGLLPAVQSTRPSLAPALKQDARRYLHRRWTLRGLLVTGQVTVSMVLLVTAFLFLRNLARTHTASPGFDPSHALVAEIGLVEQRYTPAQRTALLQTAVEGIEALPGIARAAYAFGTPLTIRHGRTSGAPVSVEGETSQFQAYWAENMVGPGYFDTLGIRLLQGRDFSNADGAGMPLAIVVNEEFVRRYLGARAPLGLRLLLPGATTPDPYEIVGVVANSKHRTLGEAQMAAIYFAYLQRPGSGRIVHVLARTKGVPDGSRPAVTKAISGLDPTAAVDVQTMRQTLAFAFLPSRVGAALLGGIGLLGLTLAMTGLYALLSYSVSRRTREIGVRMALGATTRAVARLVVGDAVVLVAAGIVAGMAIAALITKPLAMFLVAGLDTSDPVSFVGTAVLLALVSVGATWVPMRRAMHVDPVVALRDE